jgi:hypothetical protein
VPLSPPLPKYNLIQQAMFSQEMFIHPGLNNIKKMLSGPNTFSVCFSKNRIALPISGLSPAEQK